METYKEQIINCYGPYMAMTNGKLSASRNSNCYKVAKNMGFNCFAVAGARAGQNRNDGYDIYFFRGTKPEDKPSFRGVIQFY